MNSDETITRILVLLDRRLGKRSLINMKNQMADEPKIVQLFYKLRCESEKIYSAYEYSE